MSKTQNPLRELAAPTKFAINGGTDNLVANGVYSVEDIVKPLATFDPVVGDPRLFVSEGHRRSKIRWRKVNRNGWISPKRQSQDDKDTVIQIKFAKPKKFNFIAFELLRVPQLWNIKYYDASRKKMVALTNLNGKKVDGSLSGFKINTRSPGKDKDEHKKWRRFDYRTPTIRTNLIEIHLNREVDNPPIENLDDFFGFPQKTPYSLGIRNLKVKFRVRDDGDVDDGGDDDGTPGPIGTTERAIIKRHTSIMAHDGGEVSYWECAPQGAATSVVPYYMDVRAADGSASVFDTLKLVPLWAGPSMSVYYSNDDTTLPWTLSPNRVDLEGLGDTAPTFTQGTGIQVDAADSAYSVSNTYLRMETSKNFSMGLRWKPTFTNSGNDRWLFNFEDDTGNEFGLKFDPSASGANTMTGQFKVMQDATTVLATFSDTYTLNIDTQYGVVIGYNQNDLDSSHPRGWYLALSVDPSTSSTIDTQFTVGDPPNGFLPTFLRIGTNAAMDRSARGYLSYLWAKLDGYTERMARNFLLAPDAFISGEGDTEQRTNGHYKGILAAKLTNSLEVRVGPGAGYFRNKEWTPVPIDYTLSTTQYQLPVTTAKYLKLEFSNLIARTYLTDLEELPVTDFPAWVKDWYRSVSTQRQGIPYGGPVAPSRNFFEGVPPLKTPGDRRKHPRIREILEGKGGGGLPPITFHRDQGSADAMENPELFDRVGIYNDLQFSTTPLRFYVTSHHAYETRFVSVERRAFFVGLKELQVFRSDHTVLMDNPEYAETYDDDQYVASKVDWINVGGSYQAQEVDAVITSEEFQSFSKFDHIQAAVLDNQWESPMSRAQIDLASVTHVTDPQEVAFDDSTETTRTYVTGQYQGARGGNVLQLTRTSGGTEEYGIRTASGLFDGFTGITGANARTSAVVRMQLPQTNLGTYELRLYAFDSEVTMQRRLVAKKQIKVQTKSWQEIEVAYVANTGDLDWVAEVVQTNPDVDEPFVVDMLGIWQAPIKWEFSNDGGDTWQVALWPLNKPNGYIRFLTADNRLVVRATALRDNAVVSGWTVVPWYIESPMVVRAPIDLNPPWNASDSANLLDTSHKPMFRMWNHWFPQAYSVNLYGYY